MKFGDRAYTIFGLAGPQNDTKFCTVEELTKGNTNRICIYSSRGELLSECPLGVSAIDLEVNDAFSRAIVYDDDEDSVSFMDLKNGVTISETPCHEPHFIGFVENAATIQDASGKIWRLDDVTGARSFIGNAPPILAWSSDGCVRAIKHKESSILVINEVGRELFAFPRLGMRCYDPLISIVGASNDILVIEVKAGIRLFSTRDRTCKVRLRSSKDISFEYACLAADDSEVIAFANDRTTALGGIFYRGERHQMTEICRVDLVPLPGHFFDGGTLFASSTGDLVNLSAPK